MEVQCRKKSHFGGSHSRGVSHRRRYLICCLFTLVSGDLVPVRMFLYQISLHRSSQQSGVSSYSTYTTNIPTYENARRGFVHSQRHYLTLAVSDAKTHQASSINHVYYVHLYIIYHDSKPPTNQKHNTYSTPP